MNTARSGLSVRIGFAVLLALLALQVSTGTASAQGEPSVYIAPTGLADHGTATVSGSLLIPGFSYGDFVGVEVEVEQRLNGKVTVGQYAFSGALAVGTSFPWSVTVVPVSGSFKPGYVTVRAIAYIKDVGYTELATRQVLLRPR
jgi:hypothetical protein